MATTQREHPPVGGSLLPFRRPAAAVLELLRPGHFVRLNNHPDDLPPFQVLQCRGGRCWVRQQSWGSLVQWEVAHRLLRRVG